MTRYELAVELLKDKSKLNEQVVVENGHYCGYLSVDEIETEEVRQTTKEYRARTCDLYTDYVKSDDEFDEVEPEVMNVTVIY